MQQRMAEAAKAVRPASLAAVLLTVGGGFMAGGLVTWSFNRGGVPLNAPSVMYRDRSVPVEVEKVTYAARPCLLSSAIDEASPIAGWKRMSSGAGCFTVDYPSGWTATLGEAAAVITDADGSRVVSVSYPTADATRDRVRSREHYMQLLQPGAPAELDYAEFSTGFIGSKHWTAFEGDMVGDAAVGKEFLVVTGRGTFEMQVTRDVNEDGAVLEAIAKTFKAQ